MSEKSHVDLEKMTIGKVPIGCLTKAYQGKDVAFRIPNYQRGYRWKAVDVLNLLRDLEEFIEKGKSGKDSRSFYCLQPLVVKISKDSKDCWEVVDGQQRLTTLFLLWKYLNDQPPYDLSYDTRDRSRKFLNSPNEKEKGGNIDFHHIYHAHQAIQTWFNNEEHKKREFRNLLDDSDDKGLNARFIWYQLGHDDDAVEAFTRLNDRKIPLTDEELIRALFLSKREVGNRADGAFQHRFALEWDRIETALQEPDFWGFVSKKTAPEGGRIRLLFEINAGKCDTKVDHWLFRHYDGKLNDSDLDALQVEWQRIVSNFEQLEEWYCDSELFHLVGYVTTILGNGSPDTLRKLLQDSKDSSKLVYAHHLRNKIRVELIKSSETLADFIDGLNYLHDSGLIRPTLALFNIATILSTDGVRIRFPFHLYHDMKNGWDIEHIQSQAGDRMTDEAQTAWLAACKHELEHEVRLNPAENSESEANSEPEAPKTDAAKLANSLLAAIDEFNKENSTLDLQGLEKKVRMYFREKEALLAGDLLNAIAQYSESDSSLVFSDLEKDIRNYFMEEDVKENKLQGIGNLTLLDAYTNRSYGNAPFVVKRTKILEAEKKGIFILPCTRDLFLKVFSKNAGNLRRWDVEKDGAAHKESIYNTLDTFFTQNGASK